VLISDADKPDNMNTTGDQQGLRQRGVWNERREQRKKESETESVS
jgi:hypothetical protein